MVARIAVVVPVYDQEAWLPAALSSLLAQTFADWECVVVDDGSPGDVVLAAGDALDDPRITLVRHGTNRGLGAALNTGLDATTAPYVAYVPADDVVYADHLATLHSALEEHPDAPLAVAGVRHHTDRESAGRIEGEPLQLVQVLHRRTSHRWVVRSELTTDDLDRMLWDQLLGGADPTFTGRVTCTWTEHPRQRHTVLREPLGGLNPYRSRYRVAEPLRLQSSAGSLHDEVEHYRRFRDRPPTPRAQDGLRILLVGELAHNPERILTLPERGHELHGLWIDTPAWFTTVGPLPFGHVQDVDRSDWRRAVRELQPDIIYGLLNWHAIPFAREVLAADLGIPFVWHLKEGPAEARALGHWSDLVDLHTRSDGVIYSSPELQQWFEVTVPAARSRRSLVIDGDLPKAEWFAGQRSELLSATDGDVHTVIAGRPMGPSPDVCAQLADAGVHLHVYGKKVHVQKREWVEAVRRVAPDHLHLHPQVDQEEWVREFSRYDAGWLHDFSSRNRGDLHAATWDDLNYPARMGTYAVSGVPMISRRDADSIVASRNLVRDRDLGVLWDQPAELVAALRDRSEMSRLRASIWSQREHFTFDAHVDDLVAFFQDCIYG